MPFIAINNLTKKNRILNKWRNYWIFQIMFCWNCYEMLTMKRCRIYAYILLCRSTKKLQRVCQMDGDIRKRIKTIKLDFVFMPIVQNTRYNFEEFMMAYITKKVDVDYNKPYDYAQVDRKSVV